jgi:hypothetical protein
VLKASTGVEYHFFAILGSFLRYIWSADISVFDFFWGNSCYGFLRERLDRCKSKL